MRTLTQAFQDIRNKKQGYDLLRRLLLLPQYQAPVASIVTGGKSVYVDGQMAPMFPSQVAGAVGYGDMVYVSSKRYDGLLPLVNCGVISNGRTAVNFDVPDDTFTDDDIGAYLAPAWDVTHLIADGGLSVPDLKLEGESLNKFDSGQMSVVLNDPNKWLYDSDSESGPLYMRGVMGTATSNPVAVGSYCAKITDTNASFTVDGLFPGELVMLSGAARGKRYHVYDNDADDIYVRGRLDTDGVVAGDRFIVNRSRVVYFQLHLGIEGATDQVMVMGGLIAPKAIQYNAREHTLSMTGYGMLRDLERTPAYLVSQQGGLLPKMRALKPLRYVEPPAGAPVYGPRPLRYRFESAKLTGIDLKSIESETHDGVYRLQFRRPTSWRWAMGAWTIPSGAGDSFEDTLPAHADVGGGDLTAEFQPGSYPLADDEDIAIVTTRGTQYIVKWRERVYEYPRGWRPYKYERDTLRTRRVVVEMAGDPLRPYDATHIGHPVVTFDNGPDLELRPVFDVVYWYKGGWTDRTVEAETRGGTSFSIADDTTDYLYLGARRPFGGAYFVLDDSTGWTGAGNMTMQYWDGTAWQTLTFTDLTDDFDQDGLIYWDIPLDWALKGELDGSSSTPRYYYVRIGRTINNVNTAKARQILRYQEATGAKADKLGFVTEFEYLTIGDLSDDVVIVADANGDPVPATWYTTTRLYDVVTRALDAAFYGSTKRELADCVLTSSAKFVAPWGRIPYMTSNLKVTASCFDKVRGEFVVGLENELWLLPREGEPQLIWRLPPRYEVAGLAYSEGDDSVSGMAIRREKPTESRDPAEYPEGQYSLMFELTSDNTAVLYWGYVTFALHEIVDTRYIYRTGCVVGANLVVGQLTGSSESENVIVPFPQLVIHADTLAQYVQFDHDVNSLFDEVATGGDGRLPEWLVPGFYVVSAYNTAATRLGLRVNWGTRKAFGVDYLNAGMFLESRPLTLPNCNALYFFSASSGGVTASLKAVLEDRDSHFQAMTTGPFQRPGSSVYWQCQFLAYTYWIDNGSLPGNHRSPTFIDMWVGQGLDGHKPKQIVLYDNSAYTDETDADPKTIPKDVGDYIAVGFKTKWCTPTWGITTGLSGSPNVVAQYWDGADWVNCTVHQDDTADMKTTGYKTHWFSVPWDRDLLSNWVADHPPVFPGSDDLYYIRFRIQTAGGAEGEYTDVRAARLTVWESGDSGAWWPVDMCYNPNQERLYVTFLDRGLLQYRLGVINLDLSSEYPTRSNDPPIYTTLANFDNEHAIQGMVYHSADHYVYACETDARHNEVPARLVKISSSGGVPIVNEVAGEIMAGECHLPVNLMSDGANDRLYGFTADVEWLFWQYATEFDVRLMQASFGESDTVRTVVEAVAEIMAMLCHMKPTGDLVLKPRAHDDAATSVLAATVQAVYGPSQWPHSADAVAVNWRDHRGRTGTEVYGDTGFGRRVLTIDNPFVQTPHMARVVAENLWYFLANYRRMTLAMFDLWLEGEITDAISVDVPAELTQIDLSGLEWLVIGLQPNPLDGSVGVMLLERILPAT